MIERMHAGAPGAGPPENVEGRSTGAEARTASRRADAFWGDGVDATIDAGLAAFVRHDDAIVHVGMNRASVARETATLARFAPVVAVSVEPPSETGIDEETFLAKLGALGLRAERGRAILDAVRAADPSGREELAALALVWAVAENGTRAAPSRLVLSGHSSGETFWDGEGAGQLDFADVRRLALAMPRAAAHVEDVHLSACSTGGQAALADRRAEWLAAFPNLRTIWGYDGAAPEAGGGHLADWAMATRGRTDRLALTPSRAREHVALWDRTSGYRDGAEPLARVRARALVADGRFEDWVSGARRPRGADDAALVADYRTYQALSKRSDVPPAEREDAWERAETLLRVRYFEPAIGRAIDRELGEAIESGYRALGRTPPTFAGRSLADAIRQIDEFEQALARANVSSDPSVSRTRELLAGVRSLHRGTIPHRWCRH
jgi:hypothetical protein